MNINKTNNPTNPAPSCNEKPFNMKITPAATNAPAPKPTNAGIYE